MKLINKYRTSMALVGVFVAFSFVTATALAIAPGSVQYKGADTVGPNFPAFNIYYDVPSVGNEADFIRVKKDGEPNSALTNTYNTTCKTGDRFDVWFYVHNGANQSANQNGTGPGVAKNVVAKVNLPQGDQTSFNVSGGVTASNASAINDGATINCGGKKFKMSYVSGSGTAFLDLSNKVVSIPDSIANGGAPIGTNALDGNLWGCWEQRVWMGMKVVVTEVVEPPKPQSITCDALQVAVLNRDKREIEAKVTGSAQNTTIKGYKIDFGDGTVANTQTAKHSYAKDGSYKIVASVTGTISGTDKTVSSANCEKTVEFKTTTEPVYTCDALQVEQLGGRKVRVSTKYTAKNGATFSNFKYDFGDSSEVVITKDEFTEHTYTADGQYKIVASVIFTVNGKTETVSSDSCVQYVKYESEKPVPPVTPPVTPPTTPPVTTLPVTGAEGIVGLMAGVSILGAIGHRIWSIRRL